MAEQQAAGILLVEGAQHKVDVGCRESTSDPGKAQAAAGHSRALSAGGSQHR
jgi:hypothetical protein